MASTNIIKNTVDAEESFGNETCGICFTHINPADNPRGRLNSCNHLFCAYCIKEWAQSTNVCPHCKARFTRIFVVDATGKEEVTKVRKRNFKLWEEDDNEEENSADDINMMSTSNVVVVCNVCAQSSNASRMILCDRRQCTYTVHLDCIPVSERPAEFFCPDCTRLRSTVLTNSACTSSASLSNCLLQQAPAEVAAAGQNTEDGEQLQDVDGSLSMARSAAPSPSFPPAKRMQKMAVAPPAWLKTAVERGAQLQLNTERERQPEKTFTSSVGKSPSSQISVTHEAGLCDSHLAASMGDNSDLRRSAKTAMQQYLHRQEQRNYQAKNTRQCQLREPLRDIATHQSLAHRCKRARASSEHSNIAAFGATAAGDDMLNPATQRREEEALGRRLALEMLPILRRNRLLQENRLLSCSTDSIVFVPSPTETDAELREKQLYSQAMSEGRRMARERIEAMVANARLRKERLIKVQALRESAALEKLAKIVASHRGKVNN